MSAGITVYNTNHNIQIDGTYKNMCYEYSVSGVGTWELAVNQDLVYVMSPPQGVLVGVAPFAKSDTQPYYRFYGSCTVHVYSLNQGTGDNGYGLRIYNQAEEVVFNSNKVQLKILDYVYGHLQPISVDIRNNANILLKQKTYSTTSLGILIGQAPVGLNWYKQTNKFSGMFFKIQGNVVEARFMQMHTISGSHIVLNSFDSYGNVDVYSYIVVDTAGIP